MTKETSPWPEQHKIMIPTPFFSHINILDRFGVIGPLSLFHPQYGHID